MGEQVAARLNGGVAQLGEHLPCKQGVKGSNPLSASPPERCFHILFTDLSISSISISLITDFVLCISSCIEAPEQARRFIQSDLRRSSEPG